MAQLRILATTDLHMQLTGYDYVADRAIARPGLAGLGTLITQARAEAKAQNRGCLLFDNGDTLQGSAMGAHLAQHKVTPAHPVVASLNHLSYDAVGIGNHDLDFGMPYLQQVATQLNMPMVASNLDGRDLRPLQGTAIVSCKLPTADPDDQPEILHVGIISVLPQLTAVWNKDTLGSDVDVTNALSTVRNKAKALRTDGAELVVVLAHMGISQNDESISDTAIELAQVLGIDAMITGHTHRRFPGKDHQCSAGVDPCQGRLLRVPTVMPGHDGSDLGVLDLTLRRKNGGAWKVIGHVSSLRDNTAQTLPLPAILSAVAPVHQLVHDGLAMPVGQTDVPLQNYFSLLTSTATGTFVARAKAQAVRAAVQGTDDANLPLLASASAHTAGGRAGPDHYLHIPEGPILRRHLAGLYPYNNRVWAIRITGSELRDWLENAAGVYAHHTPSGNGTDLLDHRVPPFNFESIYGLRYGIDPTRPLGARITDLTFEDAPIRADQMFLLATNQFRVAGGGGFQAFPHDRIAARLPATVETILTTALTEPETPAWDGTVPWALTPGVPLVTQFKTSPACLPFLSEIAHLSPEPLGLDDAGFLRLRLTL